MSAEKERPAWYREQVTSISDDARALLETYSRIPPQEVLAHVLSIRDAGFEYGNYACVGQLRFLDHSLHKSPYYQRIVERLRSGVTLLDAGCCFGTELRYLVSREGIPGEQLYGFDIESRFINLGYDLFRDRDSLRSTLVRGDLATPLETSENAHLAGVKGNIDVVYASSVLHLWGWDGMLAAAKRLVELTSDTPGTMIVGKQLGSLDAKECPMPYGVAYRHNVGSMKSFWEQISRETGTRWLVEAETSESEAVTENRNQW
ncbi:hypothetical protein H2200_010996 [Cladophialophora chaetospira]|uniref:Methyltransferase domain-containing protein n=1 Tax=Cladophialophora chaetospira TaxID=386627 RepID=A0AA39CE22_9EURO|nr:hypothetical protein H2200_010996 [Cladophialophora chaetospira]